MILMTNKPDTMKNGYYVVWVGRVPGVYNNWLEADEQVNGYSGALHNGDFATRLEAEQAYKMGYEKWANDKRKKNKGGPPLY